MMEKQNRTVEKTAAGDSRDFDDIVDFAAGKMEKVHMTDPHLRRKELKARGKELPPQDVSPVAL